METQDGREKEGDSELKMPPLLSLKDVSNPYLIEDPGEQLSPK